ncbi:hypothetical protein AS188_07695 [Kocuria flava]|uniref:Uncharacterized protein n=1 Tax=Kocuria flava TaxID=446860 RepID=A0A0U3HQ45_9MICC|nr:hypothetical protein [Kocuria flava]ALU39654.1 hypothetical protein AS188_07695 [Kocuria flava]PLC13191.1 hypothetical protein AUQ48_14435 [Kocuria flava]GEO91734.1 hypothetical protein KFL01_10400 [Kocuria flava]
MTTWEVRASIRPEARPHPAVLAALRATLRGRPGTEILAMAGGIGVRLLATSPTPAGAYALALAVLTTDVLPVLDPAELNDLQVRPVSGGPAAGHPLAA